MERQGYKTKQSFAFATYPVNKNVSPVSVLSKFSEQWKFHLPKFPKTFDTELELH